MNNEEVGVRMNLIPTLLGIEDVCKTLGIKKSTVYKWMDEKRFPRPLKLSPTCVRWKETDIADWVNAQETT